MIYTGPIDAFFDYRFGKLPYRSLEFRHVTLPQEQFQAVGTVNYPNDYGYTRITEFKHITGQTHPKTSIVYEYPRADGDPYYPVPRPENAELYRKYEALAEATEDVTFVGRLATYKYYNMDQVVGQALAAFKRLKLAPQESRRSAKALTPDEPREYSRNGYSLILADRMPGRGLDFETVLAASLWMYAGECA